MSPEPGNPVRDASPGGGPASSPVAGVGLAGTLGGLGLGVRALVCRVGGDRVLARRLLEMGLLPATEVEVVRRAALGDPIEVRVRNYRLSLRLDDGHAIEVLELAPGTPPPPPPGPPAGPLYGARVPVPGAVPAMPLVLVAGNPNSGKTTIFNALTGARARVGNYPGVTVERKSREVEVVPGTSAEICDLPGTYSLSARSPEEQVAVDALLGLHGNATRPAAVVVVVDATALERSLYLAVQILETGVPVVLALNMMDEARAAGLEVDAARLGALLGAEVVATVGSRDEGIPELRQAIGRAVALAPAEVALDLDLPSSHAAGIARIEEAIRESGLADTPARRSALARWSLLSLGADELRGIPESLRRVTESVRSELAAGPEGSDLPLVSARYRLVDALAATVSRAPGEQASSWTDRIDSVLTHRVAGSLVFVAVMALIFQSIFAWCEPLVGAVETGIQALQQGVAAWLPEGLLAELLRDGVIAGVGNVLVFVPQIAVLFLLIGFLEDCGYLARVAFLIDRVMGAIGLHGKAFVPMLSGFACAVPAVMATRTLENRQDRLLTMITLPLMSCSARLPIYVLVAAVVFPGDSTFLGMDLGAFALALMYLVSVAVTLGAAMVLRRTVLKGARPPLLLELPPYRWPVPRNLLATVGIRLGKFVREAGTTILAMTVALWVLLHFPRDPALAARFEARRAEVQATMPEGETRDAVLAELAGEEARENLDASYGGRLGKAIEPVFAPLGFDWRVAIGVIGSFAAREVFVSTLGIVFGIQEADEGSTTLREALQKARWPDGRPLFTPLMGFSLMLFFVLAMQCMSTLAVLHRESGSWKWPAFTFAYMSVLAYGASLLVYQVGRALGF